MFHFSDIAYVYQNAQLSIYHSIPENKVHGANIGPNWVLSAQDGPHVGPMNLAIRDRKWKGTTNSVFSGAYLSSGNATRTCEF